MKNYDVVVIGGGIGGYVSAIRLAQNGLQIALIEKEYLGGECLNYGCIPTKALVYLSYLVERMNRAKKYGVNVGGIDIDIKKFNEWRRTNIVARLRKGVEYLLTKNGVEIIKGKAKLKSSHEVCLSDGTTIRGEKIVIATGSLPKTLPGVEFDGERIIDSRKAIYLEEIPDTMCIIGAGAIGIEIGQALAGLGVKVTIVEVLNRLLPMFSSDIVAYLKRRLEEDGVEINLGTYVKSVERIGNRVKVTVSKGEETKELEADYLLVAVGRKPNTIDLNLEGLGVKTDERGAIVVNEQRQTSVPNIYAVGDVIGNPMLAHKALADALIATSSILGKKAMRLDPFLVPVILYSRPEVAKVGYSEEEARKAGLKIKVGRFPFRSLGRAATIDEAYGLLKLIMDENSGKIIGMEVIGPEASELISLGNMAISLGIDLEKLAEVIYPHPTCSEAFGELIHWFLEEPIHMLK